jgi:nitrite reductase (NADH) small subunit
MMVQGLEKHQIMTQWFDICELDDITPNTGVCALVENQQVAIFRWGSGEDLFAISNYDPFSKANILSRGIVGDRNGIPKVASPIYKQNFNLRTGEYLDDSTVKIPTYQVRVVDNKVQLAI